MSVHAISASRPDREETNIQLRVRAWEAARKNLLWPSPEEVIAEAEKIFKYWTEGLPPQR